MRQAVGCEFSFHLLLLEGCTDSTLLKGASASALGCESSSRTPITPTPVTYAMIYTKMTHLTIFKNKVHLSSEAVKIDDSSRCKRASDGRLGGARLLGHKVFELPLASR